MTASLRLQVRQKPTAAARRLPAMYVWPSLMGESLYA
jgi:hypothetical protein